MSFIRFADQDPIANLLNLQKMLSTYNRQEEEDRPFGRDLYPPVNLFETAEEVLVKAELPGLSTEALELHLKDNQLTIAGKIQTSYADKVSFLRNERLSGEFSRTVELPAKIDPERAKANLKNGLLTIAIAKQEEAKPRQISISTK